MGVQILIRGVQKFVMVCICIPLGIRRHNRIHTLIQGEICEKPKKCSEMGIFLIYQLLIIWFTLFLSLFTAKLLDIKGCFEVKFKKVITQLLIKFFSTLTCRVLISCYNRVIKGGLIYANGTNAWLWKW